MASTYLRPDSPFIWIRYKDATGKWKNANTGYRKNSGADSRQANLLAKEKSLEEAKTRGVNLGKSAFADWAPVWIEQRWANKAETLRKYRRCLKTWLEYLAGVGIAHPGVVTRETVLGYVHQRESSGAARNTALSEIKLITQVMDESVKRGFARDNPARRLGLAWVEKQHKQVWTPEQIQRAIDAAEPLSWIQTALLLGKYQASRLGQCEVPLTAIDFDRQVIAWPGSVMKQGKAFVQSIDPSFIPALKRIVEHRRALGESTLATLPKDPSPSLHLRGFLDGLGLQGLSQHGLRTSWVTRAALAGIPESVTMKFTNHSSREVHAVYQQISAGDMVPFFARLNG
jgi:integrase